ncbi:accessory factor associated with RNA polymerase II [Ceratocystis pirilliformis]|uniref:Accessory factor associated with RNA polymerase II n=1 Tax=Ceratocystis pirilliformis TaxID=259994 RepID=A0ABR3YG92_9PEZI
MSEQDPLLLLRQSISTNQRAVPTSSADPLAGERPLSTATHLRFPHINGAPALPLTTATRFSASADGKTGSVDLRSIYFAWLNREVAIPEYSASAARLNEQLGALGKVQNLAFVERLDLVTWLEGASEESEHIKPFTDTSATGATTGSNSASKPSATSRAAQGPLDPKLAAVYSGERRIGNRNTVLRGSKPTDFSHVRKLAAAIISKRLQHPGTSSVGSSSAVAKPNGRRPDPIILLSPSASSILRMANARAFLEQGRFENADGPGTGSTILHITRMMRSIDPTRPIRFILVESTEHFKPEYWNRLVAVFTTGQAWQFRSYKWPTPLELFRHVLGIYVGWRGDAVPETVRTWTSQRFITAAVDRWRGDANGTSVAETSKVRDAETVELIWKGIEENMRSKGWRRDAAPTRI